MTSDRKKPSNRLEVVPNKEAPVPEWADGLKSLYKSVVDEPLPDSFRDLLAKLDDPSSNETN